MNKYAPLVTPILLTIMSIFTGIMVFVAKDYHKDFKAQSKTQTEILSEIRSVSERQTRTEVDVQKNREDIIQNRNNQNSIELKLTEMQGDQRLNSRKLDELIEKYEN